MESISDEGTSELDLKDKEADWERTFQGEGVKVLRLADEITIHSLAWPRHCIMHFYI